MHLLDFAIPVPPIIFLTLAWDRMLRAGKSNPIVGASWVPLIIATLSDAYFWLALTSPELVLGPVYSDARKYIIWANLLTALAVTVLLCFRKNVARWWLLAASVSLLLQWLWVAAVSAAV